MRSMFNWGTGCGGTAVSAVLKIVRPRRVHGRDAHVTSAILAVCLALFLLGRCARAAEPIDYDRDVLPILSDNCYKCHGPDAATRKAGLRFDTKDGAFRVKDGKSVMTPGNSAASELVRRISSTDPDEKMPPPKSLRKLTAGQI